ncbi:MAG: cation diffusion facilitator family transporter [Planctomycetota bacterium]|jgi:cation diffusion facilitator family transporter|nr:cation diffusion facilitator family transporter [Planctomycetota bacterium]
MRTGLSGHSGSKGFRRFSAPSAALAREVSRVTWMGLGVNAGLAALKGAAGFASGSHALLADAVHTISDLATDAAILIGVRYWYAPADAQHPHGHQKIETLVTFAIGLSLAAVGAGLGWAAAGGLVRRAAWSDAARPPELGAAGWFALAAALLSIASKEMLYHWTAARGMALGSPAVIANAWHHRSDALSSIPPALAIAASGLAADLGHDWRFLDNIGALVVCVLLIQAAWDVIKPALSVLIDAGADRRLSAAIHREILETPGVAGAHHVRTRAIGAGAVEVDLHIAVDPGLTVREGHAIAASVTRRVLGLPPAKGGIRAVDVMVHVDPADNLSRGADHE